MDKMIMTALQVTLQKTLNHRLPYDVSFAKIPVLTLTTKTTWFISIIATLLMPKFWRVIYQVI